MIVLQGVYKRYRTRHGLGKWILNDVSLSIPATSKVGLIGANGAGKSTLLRLIGGIDHPSRGQVNRNCRVSWPIGLAGGLQGSLTGRQNVKFVCRLHGHETDLEERIAYVQEFCQIGSAFEEPINTYSTGMQARLKFALSLAFDFDVYLVDELTSVGDIAFRKKASTAFKNLANRAGLIMVSHGENTLLEFCQSGIWLTNGHAYWFDSIHDALVSYKGSLSL